jgi:exodeoxyribonuclease VII large subunit
MIDAISVLDRDPTIDVIVLARGGGSTEDLLPFSDEALCRAVFACTTPVVSAIGHETDAPLVDYVADVRASTPTDVAKRIVPDLAEEVRVIAQARARIGRVVNGLLDREQHRLDALRSRPVLARPEVIVESRAAEIGALAARAERVFGHRLDGAERDIAHTIARLRALSPKATLDRGYAIVHRTVDGQIVRTPSAVVVGDALRIRVAEGDFAASVAESSSGEPDTSTETTSANGRPRRSAARPKR